LENVVVASSKDSNNAHFQDGMRLQQLNPPECLQQESVPLMTSCEASSRLLTASLQSSRDSWQTKSLNFKHLDMSLIYEQNPVHEKDKSSDNLADRFLCMFLHCY
jgi:hypothetical protein